MTYTADDANSKDSCRVLCCSPSERTPEGDCSELRGSRRTKPWFQPPSLGGTWSDNQGGRDANDRRETLFGQSSAGSSGR
jgi:hypothetical protein